MDKLERKIAKAEMKMAKQFLRKQRKKKKAKKARKEASDDDDSDEEQEEEEEVQEEVVKKKPKAGRGRGKKRTSELPEEEVSAPDGLADSTVPQEGSEAEAAAEAPAKASQRGTKGRAKKRAKESREDAEADPLQGADQDKPNEEASGIEKAPKRGRRSKKTEAAEEDLGGDSQLQGDEKEKPDNEASGLEKTSKRGRRGKKAGEGTTADTAEKEDSQVGEEGEAAQSSQGQGRRGKKARGEDGGKPAREEDIDTLLDWGEDLEEADDAVLQAWQQELAQRRDAGSSDDRTAFSMRERGSTLRSLKPECFLGGRRLEEGGHLLYDDEGKVNLHFLLATVKTATASGALSALRPASAHRAKLRWLASLALEMRLIGKLELKRGKVQQKRMEQARKNGNFSLLLESNLVTERRAEDGKGVPAAKAASANRTFPERAPVEATNDNRAGRQTVFSTLRSQAERRQAKIVTNSSHQLDLNKMQALIGPTFSFDWEAKGEGEEDELEVDIPESDKRSSGRNILKDQLQRSVSFRQLKSIHSSQSLGAVSTTSTPTASQDVADTLLAPPPALSGGLARRVARRGEEPSEATPATASKSAPKARIDSPAPAATEVSAEAELPAATETVAGPQEDETPTDRLADKVAEPNDMERVEVREKQDLPNLPSTSAGEDPSLCATQPLPEEEQQRPAEEVAEAAEEQSVEQPAAPSCPEVQKEVVISPTLPFEPAIPPQELAPPPPPVRKVPLEISPTLPFEPQVAEPEEEPPSRAGTAEPSASAKRETTTRSAQRALDLEDSALRDNEIEDLMEDEDHEAETESDRRRAVQEREWLKHKRRLELQSRAASNDQSALKKQAVAGKNGLGTSSMSAEEKSRYEALVSDVSQPAAEVNDAILGAHRSTFAAPTAVQRKPSFVALLAKKFTRSASDRSLAGAGA